MHLFHSLASSLACLLWLQASQSSAQATPAQETITIATEQFVVNRTNVVLHSTTISTGASAVSIDGKAVSADPSHDLFVDGTRVITGGPAMPIATDTSRGIPYPSTSCTESACLVRIQNQTSSASAAGSYASSASASSNNGPGPSGSIAPAGTSNSRSAGDATNTIAAPGSTQSAASGSGPQSSDSTAAPGPGPVSSGSVSTGGPSSASTNSADGSQFSGSAPGGTPSASSSSASKGGAPASDSASAAGPGAPATTGSAPGGPGPASNSSVSASGAPPPSSPASSGASGTASSGSAAAPAPTVHTIDGVPLTGNPTSALTVGDSTITPGGPPAVVSGHTFAIPASATGGAIDVDGSLTILPTRAPSAASESGAAPGSTQAGGAPLTSAPTSVYTVDGVAFTGNPTSLAVASTTLTPGGPPLILSGHTFSIPASASAGAIQVDGSLTALAAPGTTGGSLPSSSAPASSGSAAPGLGSGFGPVVSVTLSDASTTATYDAVVISKFSDIQTPTIIETSFPEWNSVGSLTSVGGSIIVGKGGTALIHPPSKPTAGGIIGPPGFGGPIRPPSGGSSCPSFFGISFCPPSINIAPPGGAGVDPAQLPESPDPNNPQNSENDNNNDENDNKSNQSQDKQSTTEQEKSTQSSSSTQPASNSASTTGSVTSSASSSSASSSCSACDSCITYDYAPEATPNPMNDDSQEMRKRAMAGRFDRRAKGNYYSSTTAAVGAGKCPVAKYTFKPSYPGPGAVANNEGNPDADMAPFFATATYWAVPTNPPKCGPAPGWTFMDTKEIGAAKPPWALGGNKKSVNIDHVYEVSILDEFFASQISAGFSCDDITALFDQPDSANAGSSRINTIFGQLPSLKNPDFLGMDSALNRLKGSFWNPGLEGANLGMANANAAVQALTNLAVTMAIANDAKVAALFAATNARIYSAMNGVDKLISGGDDCAEGLKDSKGDPIKANWAESYKGFIQGKIASQNDLITKTANALSAAIPTDPSDPRVKDKDKGNVKNWSTFMSNFNGAYKIDALTFPVPGDWPDNALNIQKRQNGPACTRTPSANPSVSVTSGSGGSKTAEGASGSGTATTGAGGGSASAGGPGSATTGGIPKTVTTAPTPTKSGSTGTSTSVDASNVPPPICMHNPVDQDPSNCVEPSSSSPSPTAPLCFGNPVLQDIPGCVTPATSSAPFSCSAGSNIGAATYDPATWCGCNQNDNNLYPTLTTGTGNAACAYKSAGDLPKSTVNPTIVRPKTTA